MMAMTMATMGLRMKNFDMTYRPADGAAWAVFAA
jgi:hypothetical protein